MGDPASSKIPSEDHLVQRSEVPKRVQKAPKADDVISTVTEDSFISFRKKFHFPNDLVMKVPARTDRACFPPPGYVTVYEFSLRAGLRFPPSTELIDILTLCGVCLSQFSYRAMSIVMGLIVLFRDRGVVLSSECLSRMGRLFSDAQGRVSFRSKWLDIRTRDPSKGWISNFFYVQNDWGLQEKWGKLKELPVPLHIGAEDLLRILKLPDLDALHYEVRYLSRYVDEEYLFKKSYAFKIIIEDHIQEARSHIYDVEVKALEAECAEDGFIRGFMKGVRTVHRKTGAEIEGLTPSQASSDASSDSGGEELETIDDVASTITSDDLTVILLIIAPKRFDRVHAPPPGFIAVYEMTLRAGLRFPPAPELLEIFKACGVSIPQFLCRAITIMVGLTVFFRERGAMLTVEYLSKMCKFMNDIHGRVSCRNNKKWLDFSTRDPSKNWSSLFFFVKNEWGLPEKWGRLKELPDSLNIGEQEILKILNFSDTESLQHELSYISGCMTEERLFKVGLSIQVGRSYAIQAVEEFKKSTTYRREIQRLTQAAYEKLFDVEVKILERQSLEEGFTRGFLKGIRLVHRKTGVDIEGLTPSQASEDSLADSGDDAIESELKKIFSSDDDDVEIA
ncbi:hypothetical protein IEQ34_018992 [Dendrobium chrysotoxum]|uniref:Uncharacterized protein n=3 Tax=Dendrobium chrysotoxum TaxID=161865 RepID=A0AAV7G7F7_DENCH|nr:hypothetical protein IEQ34_018992 [Dendrobium chrysotoxum]